MNPGNISPDCEKGLSLLRGGAWLLKPHQLSESCAGVTLFGRHDCRCCTASPFLPLPSGSLTQFVRGLGLD
ncbi:hypothetical protein RRG08_042447 [Elysia crispata]|uniref:Uncharacterized protein n=1 Tax=Elysia crispata TaxID=231223 RepID=A0AAE0ZBZ9_9GAST|nr:hypothetical protein RRG08_042447 [Elysia crispata]